MSGATDIVSDGKRTMMVDNGHEMMGRLSGTGCMASSIVAAFAGVSDDRTIGSVAALAAFGIAGENAAGRATSPYAFKVALFDETAALTSEALMAKARVRSV
jgi:hydroxyethylthiazole kinase